MKPSALFAIALLAGAIAPFACFSGTKEGDRCLPDLTNDECTGGTSCVAPPNCLVYVCCPPTLTADSPKACSVCPVDTGEADSGASDDEGAIDSGTDDASSNDADDANG